MSDKKTKKNGGGKATAIKTSLAMAKTRSWAPTDYSMPRFTEREIDAALAARGETRASVMAGYRTLEARVRSSRMLKEIVSRAASIAPSPAAIEPELADFRIFDDCVSAGMPAWDGSDAGRPLTLADLFGPQNWDRVFFTRVSGWSMIGDHIQDGDLLLVDPSQEPKSGDVIVAHIAGHGQVCKRLRVEGSDIFLDSSNPDFEPIHVADPTTLTVHGVVKGYVGPVDSPQWRRRKAH